MLQIENLIWTGMQLFLVAFVVALQTLCVRSCLVTARLTWKHDKLRKTDMVPNAWKPFIRPPGKSLPPLWLLLLRAVTTGSVRLVCTLTCVIVTTAFAAWAPPKIGLKFAYYSGAVGAWIAGVSRIEYVGHPASALVAPLVCPNHIGWLDFIILGATGKFGFVMSEAVSTAPIVGAGFVKMALHIGSVVLDRSSASSRDDAKIKIASMLNRMQKESHGERLLIFPEGTLTNGEYVVPFKLGSFEAMKPAQPLRLEFSNPHYSCADLDTLTAVAFHMCLPSTTLRMTWCDVVAPGPKDTPESFAENVRAKLVAKSDIQKATEGGFRDHLALHALHFPYMKDAIIQKRLLDACEESVSMLLAPGGGFSIGLYGMGSKIQAMDMVESYIRASGGKDILIRIRGYDETFPLIRTMSSKLAVLGKMCKKSNPRNQNDLIQLVYEIYRKSNCPRMILLIDSIDAGPMKTYQKFFATIAPYMCICASVDHPSIGLLWNPVQLRAFNWYWIETSTYQPYTRETSSILGVWENLIEGRFEAGTKSVSVVLNSLTGNHQDILKLLASMQLEQAKTPGLNGVRQSELLDKSTKRMIATNLSKLKSLLQELIDHKVVVEEKQRDTGNDVYWIPLDKQGLEKLVA